MNLPSIGINKEDIGVLFSPKDYKILLLQLIATAKARIYITALYLQDDEAGREILDALYQAKEKLPKLDVCVFVDAHRAQRGLIGEGEQSGNKAMYLAFDKKYQQKIGIFGIAVKSKEFLGVLHLKGIVLDNTVLYSGASINDVYLHQHAKYRLDRYYQLQSPALADSLCEYLTKSFIHSNVAINLTDEKALSKKDQRIKSKRTKGIVKSALYPVAITQDTSEIRVTPLVGCGKRGNQLNSHICQLLKLSVDNIIIFTPYFNLPKAVLKELIKGIKRGVKVTIIVGDKTSSDFYIADQEKFTTIGVIPYIYEQILQRFTKRWQPMIDKGLLIIKLWQDGENSYHLKGIVVDDRYHLLTGSNLNPRAWGLDLENGLLLDDPEKKLLDDFNNELSVICQNTHSLTHYQQLETLKEYPAKPKKLLSRLGLSKIDRLLKQFL
jgi:CDP-diacylglycerol--serine O-phosphatidyltransferase